LEGGKEQNMDLLIKNGRILDSLISSDAPQDIFIQNGKIKEIGNQIAKSESAEVIDAKGCYVMPGIIDLHVHMREPGYEYKETIQTVGEAAAHGGITTICAMPNTNPVMDTSEKVAQVQEKARQVSPVHVIQFGAITKGQEGHVLSDIKGMAEVGCHAISEDGKSVMDAALYKEAMQEAAKNNLLVCAHCEDINLVQGGVMNAGAKAEELGLKGITNEVEDVIVKRDLALAKETKVRLHLCHCSTQDSVRLLAEAKEAGLPVTGEVCPHHFTLSTEDMKEDDGNYKMNPPLREVRDVEALRQGLRENVLEVIATDHAPHSEEEKNCGVEKAAFGIVGLETMLSLTYTELVKSKILTPLQMVEKLSTNPARILGLPNKGSIAVGKDADIVIFDTQKEYSISKEDFVSKGKNMPFEGRKVYGTVHYTIVDGNVVYKDKSLL
jgi:dihydroorotase, multifunctional complex type